MKSDSIVKPEPVKGFGSEKVLYIPVDLPSRIIQKELKRRSRKHKSTGWGDLYLLKNQIVLYKAVGAPLAVLALESLLVSGGREIVILSFCGSLGPDFSIGDAAVISNAWADEGTSRHYFPGRGLFLPSKELTRKIEESLAAKNLLFRTGVIVSTDAPYRETAEWLKEKRLRGIDLVDMEVSAVFALAEFRHAKSAALMIVSDELSSGTWKQGFSGPKLKTRVEDYFFPFLK